MPICLIPVIGSLMWAQNKAKKQLKAARGGMQLSTKTRLATAWDSFQELDIVGLVLVATSLALILLPLTLSANVPGGWHNNTMRGMLLGGLILFPIFCWYETKFPRLPLVPYRFLRNRSILGACLIGMSCLRHTCCILLMTIFLRVFRLCQFLPAIYQPLQFHLRHARLVVPELDVLCVVSNLIVDRVWYRRRHSDGQIPRRKGMSFSVSHLRSTANKALSIDSGRYLQAFSSVLQELRSCSVPVEPMEHHSNLWRIRYYRDWEED